MTHNDINLLQKKPTNVASSLTKEVRQIRLVALLFLFIVPTTAAVVFMLEFFSPLSHDKSVELSLLAESSILKPRFDKVVFLNDRLNGANKFMQSRTSYEKIFSMLVSQLVGDVNFTQISIDKAKVTVSVQSVSLDSLKSFQSSVVKHTSDISSHAKFIFQDTGLQSNGIYVMNFTITL